MVGECKWVQLTLVAGHHDIGMHLEVLRDQVTDGVVLFLDDEIGGARHAYRQQGQHKVAARLTLPVN